MNLHILNDLVSVLLTKKIGEDIFVLIAQGRNYENGAVLRICSNGIFDVLSPSIALADNEDHKTQLSFAIAEFFEDKIETLECEIEVLENLETEINKGIKRVDNAREEAWGLVSQEGLAKNFSNIVDLLSDSLNKVTEKIEECQNSIKKMKGQI